MKWISCILLLLLVLGRLWAADFGSEIDRGVQGGAPPVYTSVMKTNSGKVSLGDVFSMPVYRDKLLLLTVLGVLLSLFGVFLALRGDVFLTLTISQAAACGIALGLLLHLPPFLPAALLLVLALWILTLATGRGFRNRTMVMGALFTGFTSIAVLLLSRAAEGENKLTELLFNTLVVMEGVPLVLGVIAIVLAGHLLFRRVYMSLLFDPISLEFERVPVGLIDFIFYFFQGVVLMTVIRMAGLFFPLAYTILLPGAFLIRARSLSGALLRAGIGALITVPVVFVISVLLDLPITASLTTGAVVVYIGALVRR